MPHLIQFVHHYIKLNLKVFPSTLYFDKCSSAIQFNSPFTSHATGLNGESDKAALVEEKDQVELLVEVVSNTSMKIYYNNAEEKSIQQSSWIGMAILPPESKGIFWY